MPSPDALTAEMMTLINSGWRAHVIHAAAELGLADRLAAGPQSSITLAADTHTDPSALQRFLRAMVSLDLCAECADGSFELRPLGALLCTERPDSLQPWAVTWGRYLAPAWVHLLEALRTGEPAALGDGAGTYGELAADTDRAQIFNRSMGSLTERLVPAIMTAYPLPPGSRIVDVGGGTGQLLAGYLRADPQATGLLYDQSPAIAAAEAVLHAAGVADRCQRVAGDFFHDVPPGGDVYLLKSVLHDWDDHRASEILRRCAVAMTEQSRLLIIERLAPESFTPTPLHQASASADLNLLVAFGGRVRREAEFDALLELAGLRRLEKHSAGWTFGVLVVAKESASPISGIRSGGRTVVGKAPSLCRQRDTL